MFLSVEMLDFHGDSCQGFKERNLFENDEVSSFSSEDLMLSDFDSDVDVSSDDSRHFVVLSSEDVIVLIRASWFNGYFELSFYLFDLVTLTDFASVLLFHQLSLSFTLSTLLTCLGVHSWAQLHKFFNNLSPFTFGAGLYVFPTLSITLLAVSGSFDFYLFHASTKNFS